MASGAPPTLDPVEYERRPSGTFIASVIFATLGFGLIVFRFFSLQVVEGDQYEELARIHHVGRERLPSRRGEVKDRRGRVVAQNVAIHSVSVIPHYVKEADAELDLLRELLGWSLEEFAEKRETYAKSATKKRRFNRTKLVRDLVSTRCPHDHHELEFTEPFEAKWCPHCGRHFHPEPEGGRKCEAGHRLESVPTNGALACHKCGTDYTSSSVCPYDGVELVDRPLLLRCGECDRRYNNEEATIRAHLHELPGVYVDTEMRRHYPDGELLSHILGYMNQVNARDLEKWPDNYKAGDYIGRRGIERTMERELAGRHGAEVFLKDARGLRMEAQDLPDDVVVEDDRPAENGKTVWLTIDYEMQRIVRNALRYHRSGAIVVMDPHSGEVLAIYSKPGFDPNVWSGRLTAAAKAEYDSNPYSPMINKSTTAYAPGSIYKVVTVLAGLYEGLITHETGYDCPGYYEFGGRRFRCHRRSGHGPDIRLLDSLVLSCDVYYYLLGETLGMDRLHIYGQNIFKLGQKTRIELGEKAGRVPSKDWYRKYGSIGWQPGFTLSTAVGQGALTASPLQMARLYSALVNGGILYRPMLVRQLEDEAGNIVMRLRPEEVGRLPFPDEDINAVRRSLEAVVNDTDRGTANNIRMDSLVIAGKTGTAEAKVVVRGVEEEVARWLEQDHAWFAGYAPAADPQLVVTVFIEHGGSGGKIAAPVAKQVIEQYFKRGLGEVPGRGDDDRRAPDGGGRDGDGAGRPMPPARGHQHDHEHSERGHQHDRGQSEHDHSERGQSERDGHERNDSLAHSHGHDGEQVR